MKTTKKYLWMAGCLLMALFSFTGCSEDEQVGMSVSGHWFGDMDMWIDGEKARGSEIEFNSTGWGYTTGTGIEVDYYYLGSVTHYFRYKIRNSVIYMQFDDPDLDCAIVDYRLDSYYFRGYIADYYTLQNMTYFNLRNYDRYWNEYGYGGYYVKGENVFGTDSIATLGEGNEQPRCIRGVNRATPTPSLPEGRE